MYMDEKMFHGCLLVKKYCYLIPRKGLRREYLKCDSEAPLSMIFYKDQSF